MMLRNSLIVRSFAAVIATGVGTTMPAVAAPEATADAAQTFERRAALIIETDELGEGGASMKDMLGMLEERVLRDRGVGPAGNDADPRIVVVVRPLSDDAGILDNRIDISIEHQGQTWSEPEWGFDCEPCSDGYLLNKVAVILHSAVTRLEKESKGGDDPPPDDDPPQSEVHEAAKPGPLVWSGGAIAVVGAAGIVVGLFLGLRDDRIERDVDTRQLERVQTRTPGWTTVGIGAAVLVTGGALLAVGLRRWAREKKARSSATSGALITPWVGPRGAGLGVHARF